MCSNEEDVHFVPAFGLENSSTKGKAVGSPPWGIEATGVAAPEHNFLSIPAS